MNRAFSALVSILMMLHGTARADGPATPPPPRIHAAVFLVRGSVAGSNVGTYGPFVWTGDTTWHRLSRSNVITFGLGSSIHGASRRLYVAAGNGLHRSTDDGATWKIITSWKTMEILSVLPDRRDERRLLVSTPWGVYRTTDDGMTWQERMKGMRSWFVGSLVEDVRHNGTVYARAEDDVYSSTDAGSMWRPMHAGSGSVTSFVQVNGARGTFLAGFEDQGIRITTDGGKNWRKAVTPSHTSIYTMASSADGSMLYAGGWKSGVWRSTDRGLHWTEVWHDDAIEAIFCFLVDRERPDHVYMGTDGNGVYESTDGGMHWSFAGLRGGKIKHLYLYP